MVTHIQRVIVDWCLFPVEEQDKGTTEASCLPMYVPFPYSESLRYLRLFQPRTLLYTSLWILYFFSFESLKCCVTFQIEVTNLPGYTPLDVSTLWTLPCRSRDACYLPLTRWTRWSNSGKDGEIHPIITVTGGVSRPSSPLTSLHTSPINIW